MVNTIRNYCFFHALHFDSSTPPVTGQPALETKPMLLTILWKSGNRIRSLTYNCIAPWCTTSVSGPDTIKYWLVGNNLKISQMPRYQSGIFVDILLTILSGDTVENQKSLEILTFFMPFSFSGFQLCRNHIGTDYITDDWRWSICICRVGRITT